MKLTLIAAGMLIAGSLAMGNVAAQGTAAPLEFNYGYKAGVSGTIAPDA